MRIFLHIGPEEASASRVQSLLADKRKQLSRKGVLYARSPGNKDHTRLFMPITDPGHVDPVRFNRGYITPQKQAALRDTLISDLAREVEQNTPDTLILSNAQLGNSLRTTSELERLRAFLLPLSDDITIVAHVDLPVRMLARAYSGQILEGRGVSLQAKLDLVGSNSWWQSALDACPQIDPAAGVFAETQAPNHWIDLTTLVAFWDGTFGKGATQLHSYDEDRFAAKTVAEDVAAVFQIEGNFGKAEDMAPTPPMPEAAMTRRRKLNSLVLQVLAGRQRILPRQLWRSFVQDVAVDGRPMDIAALRPITKHFAKELKLLLKAHPKLHDSTFKAPRAKGNWSKADPLFGYSPSQYLLGYMWRIDKATREEQQKCAEDLARLSGTVSGAAEAPPIEATPHSEEDAPDGLSAYARKIMPPLAVQNFETLRTSSFAPQNKMGSVNEEELAAPYTPIAPRKLPKGSTGNVIVGCMKNEAPYIVEWVAYHRAMGVDNLLIYTNSCEGSTSEILDGLQEMGVLQHRNNGGWKGNSPPSNMR